MAYNMISTNGQVRYHVDEYVIDIEEPFEDMEIDGVLIRKSDFEEFKELVLKSA